MSENISKRENMVTVDVRPEVQAGVDPFKKIMDAVDKLSEGEGLHLINSFEPVPLYTVMKMKGFDHKTEYKDGAYHIYFFKSEAGTPQEKEEEEGEEKVIELDVRGLEPPEPMVRIIEKLPEVKKNTVLLVHHHREPLLLYEKLEHLGFQATTQKIEEGYYQVRITKKS